MGRHFPWTALQKNCILRFSSEIPQRGCSSVDRVLASEAKGRGFDPRQPHQLNQWVTDLCGLGRSQCRSTRRVVYQLCTPNRLTSSRALNGRHRMSSRQIKFDHLHRADECDICNPQNWRLTGIAARWMRIDHTYRDLDAKLFFAPDEIPAWTPPVSGVDRCLLPPPSIWSQALGSPESCRPLHNMGSPGRWTLLPGFLVEPPGAWCPQAAPNAPQSDRLLERGHLDRAASHRIHHCSSQLNRVT